MMFPMHVRLLCAWTAAALLFAAVPARAEEKENSCIGCHEALEGDHLQYVNDWKEGVHARAGVACESCHGGDPKAWDYDEAKDVKKGFIGKPGPKQIVAACGNCHADAARMRQYNLRSDQLALYKTSHHGEAVLKKGSTEAATCASCHGNHKILPPSNPKSPVHHRNVPETCARCHSDAALMAKYNLPHDALEEYKASYHGTLLYRDNNPLVPTCASCHGVHGATPPEVGEIANVCGQCHGNTADYYNKGPHAEAVAQQGFPRCVDCHGNHRIEFPSRELFASPEGCAACHQAGPGAEAAQAIFQALDRGERAMLGAEELIKSASGRLIYLEPYMERMREAKSLLIEAGPVTHSLDPEAVRKITGEAGAILREVEEGIRKKQDEIRVRRFAWYIVAAVAVLWMLLVALKLRQLPNPYAGEEGGGGERRT